MYDRDFFNIDFLADCLMDFSFWKDAKKSPENYFMDEKDFLKLSEKEYSKNRLIPVRDIENLSDLEIEISDLDNLYGLFPKNFRTNSMLKSVEAKKGNFTSTKGYISATNFSKVSSYDNSLWKLKRVPQMHLVLYNDEVSSHDDRSKSNFLALGFIGELMDNMIDVVYFNKKLNGEIPKNYFERDYLEDLAKNMIIPENYPDLRKAVVKTLTFDFVYDNFCKKRFLDSSKAKEVDMFLNYERKY